MHAVAVAADILVDAVQVTLAAANVVAVASVLPSLGVAVGS